MKEKIFELSGIDTYVSIYINEEDTAKFIFGRILRACDDYIAIYMFAPDGKYDGILVTETSKVIRLEVGDKYAKRMKQLIKDDEVLKSDLVLEEQDILYSLLDGARKSRKIISIELLNSGINDIIGLVEKVDNKVCAIKQVDIYGEADGNSYVYLDDITQVIYDSSDEQILLKLWNNKK